VSEGIGVGISIIIIGCLYLFGQYLWRHHQTMPIASKITGLIGIGIGLLFILALL